MAKEWNKARKRINAKWRKNHKKWSNFDSNLSSARTFINRYSDKHNAYDSIVDSSNKHMSNGIYHTFNEIMNLMVYKLVDTHYFKFTDGEFNNLIDNIKKARNHETKALKKTGKSYYYRKHHPSQFK